MFARNLERLAKELMGQKFQMEERKLHKEQCINETSFSKDFGSGFDLENFDPTLRSGNNQHLIGADGDQNLSPQKEYLKNNEIDVESLWSIQPEIKN